MPKLRFALVLLDAVLINAGFIIGYLMRYEWRWFLEVGFEASLADYLPLQIIFTLAFLAFFGLDGVYTPKRAPSWFDRMYPVVNAAAKATIIVLAIIFVYRPTVYSRLMIVEAGAAVLVLVGIARWVQGRIEARELRRGKGVASVLVVGAGELGRSVLRTLVARPELGYRCVGFVDDDPERGTTNIGPFPALGNVNCVPGLLKDHHVDELVVTLPWSAQPKILDLARLCQRNGVGMRLVPSVLQLNLSRIDVDDFGGIPVISVREPQPNALALLIKRALDVVFGGLVLLISAPVLGVLAVLVKLESPGPAFFTQTRIGKDGKPFQLHKLRSMVANADDVKHQLKEMNEADGPLFKIRNDPRVTRVGSFIRRLSLDELPQFWNVVRGDMSVVGPRPQLPEEAAQYVDWQRERLRVVPGLTGLSQISGRSELSFDETCMLDVFYVENWSLGLDFRIALKTLPYILSARGAY